MKNLLEAHIVQPEFSMRWSWHPGDLLMWDNHGTQHRATMDIGKEERIMKRVCVY